MRGSGLDSMFGQKSVDNSPLTRELRIQKLSSRESATADDKMNVTFNIAKPAPAINTNSTASSVALQKQIQMQKL